MKVSIAALVLCTMLSSALMAGKNHQHDHEHKKSHKEESGVHVHGQAEMQMAIDKNHVHVELETPADNIVGFEHQPKNKKQKDKVAKAAKLFKDYKNLIQFSQAKCKQTKADIESPFKKGHHDHAHHQDHSTYHLRYELSCDDASKITQADLTVFDNFSGFEKINFVWVTEKGQGSADASKKNHKIDLNN